MKRLSAIMLFAFSFGFAQSPTATPVPLENFFKIAEYSEVSLSPDGKHLAVTVPQEDRTILAMLRLADQKVIGAWDYGPDLHIFRVWWVNDERILFQLTAKVGSLDSRVLPLDMYASNIDGTRRADVPNGNTYQIIGRVKGEPHAMWAQRSAGQAFLFKLDTRASRRGVSASTATTRAIPYAEAPLDFGGFLFDHEDNLRYAAGSMKEGDFRVYRRVGESWELIHQSEQAKEGRRSPIRFAADNERIYYSVSDAGEPPRIVLFDPRDGSETLVSKNERVGPSGLVWSSDERTLLAAAYLDGRPYYDFVAPDHPETAVLKGLAAAFPDQAVVFADEWSANGTQLTFRTFSDRSASTFYLYDGETGSARFLAASRRWIDPDAMSPVTPITYNARDGLRIDGYLTVPKGKEAKDLPAVVFVHGGPHGPRDVWAFDPDVQALASRGYAVLQFNYRGSGGYGEAFMELGYKNWGTTMQDDLTDGVEWAVEQGYIDPDRICIFGGSYGGYAALMSPVREPDLYKCTIGYVGVYSLPLMLREGDIPESESGRNYLARVLPNDAAGLRAQSPVHNLDKLRIPVMLVHGAKDVRVPLVQMRNLIGAMKDVGLEPEDVVVEDKEGHGFADPDNNVKLYDRIFAFLERHIGKGAD